MLARILSEVFRRIAIISEASIQRHSPSTLDRSAHCPQARTRQLNRPSPPKHLRAPTLAANLQFIVIVCAVTTTVDLEWRHRWPQPRHVRVHHPGHPGLPNATHVENKFGVVASMKQEGFGACQDPARGLAPQPEQNEAWCIGESPVGWRTSGRAVNSEHTVRLHHWVG